MNRIQFILLFVLVAARSTLTVTVLKPGIRSDLGKHQDAAWRLKKEFLLPKEWVGQVYEWLSENDSSEVENRDDQGGYPCEDALRNAFVALTILPAD